MLTRRRFFVALGLALAGCSGREPPAVEVDEEPAFESELLGGRDEVRVRYVDDEPLTDLDEYAVETVQLVVYSDSFDQGGHGTNAVVEGDGGTSYSGLWVSRDEGRGVAEYPLEPGEEALVAWYSDPGGTLSRLRTGDRLEARVRCEEVGIRGYPLLEVP